MNHPNAPFGPHRRPGYHHRSPRHHWGAQTHLVKLFMVSGDNIRPWEWSRGCPAFDRFSRRSSKSVVSPTSVLDFTRPLDGKIPSSSLSETRHVKTAPKNDNIALNGGLFEVGVGGGWPGQRRETQSRAQLFRCQSEESAAPVRLGGQAIDTWPLGVNGVVRPGKRRR